MKKAMYIHGAFSAFKPDSEKVKGLKKNFEVVGMSYTMEDSFDLTLAKLKEFAKHSNVDFVVGTSLGGLFAAELNKELGLPAVLINPCVEPKMSLSTITGNQTNFATGKKELFTEALANTYPDISSFSNSCLVCLGMKDDLIDAKKTIELATDYVFDFIINEDEDHYWEFFEENKRIKDFLSFC